MTASVESQIIKNAFNLHYEYPCNMLQRWSFEIQAEDLTV